MTPPANAVLSRNMRPPQFGLKQMLAIVALSALLMTVLPVVLRVASLDWVDDAYALWGAGDMVVNYMRDHGDRWPKGWDDLKPYFDAGGGRVGGWSFAKYQEHVSIRWDVDPIALETASRGNPRPTFAVITATAWPSSTSAVRDPNGILYRYFRERPPR